MKNDIIAEFMKTNGNNGNAEYLAAFFAFLQKKNIIPLNEDLCPDCRGRGEHSDGRGCVLCLETGERPDFLKPKRGP